MQQALRPYATAGLALVGASMIAVTPVAAPLPAVQVRPVQLVDAWSDLFTDTTANLQNIVNGADTQAISEVFSAFLTNPVGVIDAFTNLTPTVTTDITSLPAQISVELPPGLALGIAGLGSWVTTLNAINSVAANLANPESLAVILNGYLNGQDNLSLLDGTINIPAWNGILAPLQPVEADLNLTNLLGALVLDDTLLTHLNLTDLLNQLGLGNLDLGGLFSVLGLSGDGLGTLLANGSGVTDLGGLLNFLGVGDLGLGSLSLTGLLSGLGLDTNVNLNSLNLDQVLSAFGLDPNITMGLGTLLTNLGFGSFVNESLGTLLAALPSSLLQGVLTSLNGTLGTLLDPLLQLPVVGPLLVTALQNAGLDFNSLLTLNSLETALNGIHVSDLLGGQTLNQSLTDILTALGVNDVTPSGLTIGGLLHDLGFSSATGDLTLSQLLGDLGNPILGLNITDLLNSLNLGTLLTDLGLSNLPLNLTDLGDLSNLTLGDLLNDLNLGDLANVSIDPFGGLVTELVDVVPQQILAALGM